MAKGICTLDGCEKVDQLRKGLCSKHYKRLRLYGDPNVILRRENGLGPRLVHEMLAQPATDECLPLELCAREGGYPVLTVDGRQIRAGWLVLEMTGRPRPAPPGNHMLHSCDNPPCCNPKHLRWGTNEQNVLEMNARGRRRGGGINARRGAQHPAAKLTEAQVREIRVSVEPGAAVARRLGVSTSAISLIRNGKNWRHQP